MKVLLELIRVIFIFGFLGSILGAVIRNMYASLGPYTVTYEWLGFTAIFILLFVLYRNKWQFSGWYTGKDREKLPKRVSQLLTSVSILLLVFPVILSFWLH